LTPPGSTPPRCTNTSHKINSFQTTTKQNTPVVRWYPLQVNGCTSDGATTAAMPAAITEEHSTPAPSYNSTDHQSARYAVTATRSVMSLAHKLWTATLVVAGVFIVTVVAAAAFVFPAAAAVACPACYGLNRRSDKSTSSAMHHRRNGWRLSEPLPKHATAYLRFTVGCLQIRAFSFACQSPAISV
jgi:hypothetical protein